MSKRNKVALPVLTAAFVLTALQAGRSRHLRASAPSLPVPPTQALVLGSGGMLGAAWMATSLDYLQSNQLWKQEDDDLLIGTSAGSLLAALLGHGVTTTELLQILTTGKYETELGKHSLPPSPTRDAVPLRPSDPGYLFRTIRKGRAPHLGILVSSLFAEGLESTKHIEDFVNHILSEKWSSTPTWIVTAELSSGLRKIFNNHSSVTPGRAVAASCAVPALFEPVAIGSNRYIDGGTVSCHNLDLAINSGARNITVLTPISGYTKIELYSGVNKALNQFTRNTEQFSMDQIRKRLSPGINLRLVSPGPLTRELLSTSSLMDMKRLPDLLKIASIEPPTIVQTY